MASLHFGNAQLNGDFDNAYSSDIADGYDKGLISEETAKHLLSIRGWSESMLRQLFSKETESHA